MAEPEKATSTLSSTDSASRPNVDLRKRIQVVECYAIEYQDKHSGSSWHNGQLTYYKTDRKAVLFGAKNVKLAECYNIELNPPKVEGKKDAVDKDVAGKETVDTDANHDKRKNAEANPEEEQVKSNSHDLNSLLSKEPTLKEGNEFTLEDRYFVQIVHSKFVHHKPYRAAGEDLEKTAIRKRIKRIIDGQEDIFEESGVLSIRKVQSPQVQQHPRLPVLQAPPQRVHSHLATVPAQQASET